MKNQAYWEGYQARYMNVPFESNPYPPATDNHNNWNDGWTYADGRIKK